MVEEEEEEKEKKEGKQRRWTGRRKRKGERIIYVAYNQLTSFLNSLGLFPRNNLLGESERGVEPEEGGARAMGSGGLL